VEHPEDDDGNHDDRFDDDVDHGHGEDAESSHPSQRHSASTLGRPAPSPNTALLMAAELFRYRPTAEAHDNWLGRLQHLVDIAAAPRAAPAASRSLVHHNSGRAGTTAHGTPPPPPPPPPPPGPPPAAAHKAASHASSPRDCQIVQRTPPDARVEMERQKDLQKRIVEEIGQAGRQNRRAL
jgi:hypothetical protein